MLSPFFTPIEEEEGLELKRKRKFNVKFLTLNNQNISQMSTGSVFYRSTIWLTRANYRQSDNHSTKSFALVDKVYCFRHCLIVMTNPFAFLKFWLARCLFDVKYLLAVPPCSSWLLLSGFIRVFESRLSFRCIYTPITILCRRLKGFS